MFWGLDDPTKRKSVKVKKGYYAITWFEELEEFSVVVTQEVHIQNALL